MLHKIRLKLELECYSKIKIKIKTCKLTLKKVKSFFLQIAPYQMASKKLFKCIY